MEIVEAPARTIAQAPGGGEREIHRTTGRRSRSITPSRAVRADSVIAFEGPGALSLVELPLRLIGSHFSQ